MTGPGSTGIAACVAAVVLALTGCSSDEPAATGPTTPVATETSSPTPTSRPTATRPPPYLPVPQGVSLTEPGTRLRVGRAAVVAWKPTTKRIAVAKVRLLALEKASIDLFKEWDLEDETKKATPYFARARVTNLGRTDLGGLTVPLFAQAPDGVLLSPLTFEAAFEPCPVRALPEKFAPGKTGRICLAFMAQPKAPVSGLSFYPSDGFDPVTWEGRPTRYRPAKAPG